MAIQISVVQEGKEKAVVARIVGSTNLDQIEALFNQVRNLKDDIRNGGHLVLITMVEEGLETLPWKEVSHLIEPLMQSGVINRIMSFTPSQELDAHTKQIAMKHFLSTPLNTFGSLERLILATRSVFKTVPKEELEELLRSTLEGKKTGHMILEIA